MADKKDRTGADSTTDVKGSESSEAKIPQSELKQLLDERSALDKKLESQTKVKKFTLGDGGFAIKGVNDSAIERVENYDFSKGDAKAAIARDKDGYVTEETLPNGTKIKIGYSGEMHDVSSIDFGDGTKWIKNGDKWTDISPSGRPWEHGPDTEVKVTPKGDIVIKKGDTVTTTHPDGTKDAKDLKNGSVVTKDSENRVSSVTYPDGTTTRIEYDKDGNPTSVTAGDKTKWVKGSNGWDCIDTQGKSIDHMAKFDVGSDGVLIATADDGSFYRHDPDGKRSEGKVGINGRDDHGNVTEITSPDGRHQKFSYDADGNLNRIVDEHSDIRRDPTNGKWYSHRGGAEPIEIPGQYTVNKDGVFTWDCEGHTKITHFPDGTRITQDSDRTVTYNSRGYATEIRHPGGHAVHFEYDSAGNETHIIHSDGLELRKAENGWNLYKDGKVLEHHDGVLSVSQKGEILGIGRDGKRRFTIKPDSSDISRPADQKHF